VRRGIIGVNAQTITPELARALNVDRSYRVVLSDVYPGSPAERAGLRPGDVIYTLNDQRIEDPDQLRSLLDSKESGMRLLAHVLRDGRMRYLVLRAK
jgi:S1-C subfamily serine protease